MEFRTFVNGSRQIMSLLESEVTIELRFKGGDGDA